MAERKYSYNQALKKAGKMITLILDGGLGDELIYCYSVLILFTGFSLAIYHALSTTQSIISN